jgi:hypothetical protein
LLDSLLQEKIILSAGDADADVTRNLTSQVPQLP